MLSLGLFCGVYVLIINIKEVNAAIHINTKVHQNEKVNFSHNRNEKRFSKANHNPQARKLNFLLFFIIRLLFLLRI